VVGILTNDRLSPGQVLSKQTMRLPSIFPQGESLPIHLELSASLLHKKKLLLSYTPKLNVQYSKQFSNKSKSINNYFNFVKPVVSQMNQEK